MRDEVLKVQQVYRRVSKVGAKLRLEVVGSVGLNADGRPAAGEVCPRCGSPSWWRFEPFAWSCLACDEPLIKTVAELARLVIHTTPSLEAGGSESR